MDEEQNLQFNNLYLETFLNKTNSAKSIPSGPNTTLEQLLKKLFKDKQTEFETKNLRKIAKGFLYNQ